MKRSALAIVAAAGLVTALTAATYMTVTFDVSTGSGWVGKGDVQTAFGWNNKVMQDRHTSIVFDYDQTTTYTWQCQWTTGPSFNPTTHTQDKTRTFSIGGVVGSQDRKTGQWTGWTLTGWSSGGPGSGGDDFAPSCPGEGANGGDVKVLVEGSVTATVTGGGLYASYNGDRRPLQ